MIRREKGAWLWYGLAVVTLLAVGSLLTNMAFATTANPTVATNPITKQSGAITSQIKANSINETVATNPITKQSGAITSQIEANSINKRLGASSSPQVAANPISPGAVNKGYSTPSSGTPSSVIIKPGSSSVTPAHLVQNANNRPASTGVASTSSNLQQGGSQLTVVSQINRYFHMSMTSNSLG